MDNYDVVAEGTKVFGTFSYDTEKAPAFTQRANGGTFSSGAANWINSSFSVNEKTYQLSNADPAIGSASEFMGFTSLDPDVSGTSMESFRVGDFFVNYKNPDLTSFMNFSIFSYEAPLITSFDIVQELDWYDLGDPMSSGLASLNLSTIVDGGVMGARALIDVKEFHIGIKKSVDVPEPAPMILLAMGVVVIAVRPGKKYSFLQKKNGLVNKFYVLGSYSQTRRIDITGNYLRL